MLDIESNDVDEWQAALDSYDGSISSRGEKLATLDRWYRGELRDAVKKRGEDGNAHVSKDELVRLMEWKLARGKWRPRLLNFIKSLPEDDVIAASSKAFEALAATRAAAAAAACGESDGDFNAKGTETVAIEAQEMDGSKGKASRGRGKKASKEHPAAASAAATDGYSAALSAAIQCLTVLKGVGPATASAVLAVHAPDVAPFMSDEALAAACPSSTSDYTLQRYLQLARTLYRKAVSLGVDAPAENGSESSRVQLQGTSNRQKAASKGQHLSVEQLEMALFAAAHQQTASSTSGGRKSHGSGKAREDDNVDLQKQRKRTGRSNELEGDTGAGKGQTRKLRKVK